MKIVAERMRTLRESIKVSQLKLSKMVDVTQSGINRYEQGKTAVPDIVILKYADYFDVSADYLLGRTDKPQGMMYNYEPEILKSKILQEDEWSEFIEACFDPRSPMYKKLKETMMNMSCGGDK